MQADTGKRTKESQGQSITAPTQKIGGEFKLSQSPSFLKDRLNIFSFFAEQQKKAHEALERHEISIMLKDGKVIKGKSHETTPLEIAKKISKKLAENSIVARVKYTKHSPSASGKGFKNSVYIIAYSL
jgi:threonyl-tRNA synthetase